MLYVSCLTAVILVSAGFTANLWMILLGGVFEGTLLTITPALCQPFMKNITGNNQVALGIPEISVMLLVDGSESFGNKDRSTEDIKIPKSFSFCEILLYRSCS